MNTTKLFALINDEGTACRETCLCETHFTDSMKKIVEFGCWDDAIPDSWTDVTDNEECACVIC